jgi:uncharacterized protein (UPF0548 family)
VTSRITTRLTSRITSRVTSQRPGRRRIDETHPVAIRLRRPTSDELRPLLEGGRGAELTYSPVGLSSLHDAPAGFRVDRSERILGSGNGVFDAACRAVREWQVHRGAGLVVCADGPPSVGAVVAMSAPLPIGYIDVVCRVVTVVDEGDRLGFAYGSLPVHPERGEEAFTVTRRKNEEVAFEIVAVSRPRHPLARLSPAVARRLQRAATVRYLDAMSKAVS